MSEHANRLDVLAERVGNLCTLPAVAVQVLELTSHPRVDTQALKACLENDPALTSKVLKVVNSSLFGLSREVSDLNQALALLGIKPLKLLVLGFSLPQSLFDDIAADVLETYWRHTLTKAVAAREISERFFEQPGDEAFIAGLLSDLGELALVQDLRAPYINFLRKCSESSGDLLKLERDALGFDHTMLSARLLKKWRLPEKLVEAIALPKEIAALQQPPPAGKRLGKILHLAELLAQVVADHRIAALPELHDAAQAYRSISHLQIKEMVETLGERTAALAQVLSLDLPEGWDFHAVLEQAHQQMAAVASDVVEQLLTAESDELAQCAALLDETRELSAAVSGAQRTRAPHAVFTPSAVARPAPADEGEAFVIYASRRGAAELRAELAEELTAAAAHCRQARCELSLMLISLDRCGLLRSYYGAPRVEQLEQLIAKASAQIDHPHVQSLRIGDGGWAVVLTACDRRTTVQFAGQLQRSLQPVLANFGRNQLPPAALSIGVASVALPPKNFSPQELYASAARCLHAAQSGGGAGVKSIEV